MKTLIKLVASALLGIYCHTLSATSIEVCDSILTDTTWDMDTVKVDCDIVIDSAATLTIMPGTVVEFQGPYKLDVKGKLLAEGTLADYITFTASDTAGYYNNSHTGWGGIMFYDTPDENDTSKLTYCNIEYAKNTHSYPDYYGGAIGIKNFSKLVISNCLIRYNYSGCGAAIAVCNARPVIQNNHILLNNGSSGAGIYLNCYVKIQNNVICNNNGTGIHISEASPEIVNNTVCCNKEGLGCGFGSNPIIKNSIFRGNTYNQIFLYKDNNHPEIEYCNIEGGLEDIVFNYSIYVYEHNIDKEPYFTDIENQDYSLTDSSFCINRGTTDTTGLNLPAYDIEGNPRIYDGELDIIDIGAYEFQGDPVNRPPVISEVEDTLIYCNDTLQMKVNYYDPDIYNTHTISITSDNPHISINNLSGDTSGSTYEIIPEHNWTGIASIYVEVTDNYGVSDTDTIRLEYTNHFCGIIYENTTWDIDTVKVDCDIFVDTNATLTIAPGTVVEFQGHYKIDVKGRLLAVGRPSEYITFTTYDTTGYYNNSHTGWAGIIFYNTPADNDSSKLIYCRIEYAKNNQAYPKYYKGLIEITNFSKLVISNCLIRYNYPIFKAVIGVRSAQPVIKNNYIQFNNNNRHYGAIYLSGNAKIQNNVISDNNAIGIFIEGHSPTIINNTICRNRDGILIDYLAYPVIKNSIIWYNAGYQFKIPAYLRTGIRSKIENCNIQGGIEALYSDWVISDVIIYKDNINLEPYFTDIENNDYSLTDSSYCINAGPHDTAGLNIGPCDIAGNPRIYQGFNARIDIGAYEFQGVTNIKPILKKTTDQYTLISKSKVMTIDFIADGSVSINILSDNNNVKVANLSGDTTGSKYELIPAEGWSGEANITVEIENFSGDTDCDTFKLYVSKYFCANITKDELWDVDTVKIICDLIIDAGATLTIDPGTVVEFHGPYKLNVKGRLLAVGRPSSYITFTTIDTTGYHNNTHAGWEGIIFYNTPVDNDSSKLIYCRIEYARNMQSFPNYYGGAIGIINLSKLVVSDCMIRFNYAYYGGGIAIYNAQPVISNNYILYNSASRGAGIWTNCNVKLKNNVISNNNGEGIYIGGASPEIINNTICHNREGIASRFSSNAVIKNSILWGNKLQLIFWENYDNYAEIEYCDIEGGLEGITYSYCVSVYENNIDLEPYFTDIDNMDYSLSDSSYCINTGTPDTTGLRLPAVDITGNSRIYDGTIDIIDIGAYEFQGDLVNRPPVISKVEDTSMYCLDTLQMKVEYYDPDIYDTHTISVTSDSPFITVSNLTGDTSGSTYDIIPDHNWKGSTNIYVEVIDSSGANDIDTFNLEVTNHFCGHITENTTWNMDTAKVDCDIVIDSAATLTIAPGTVVEFQGEYLIDIQGSLLAEGTQYEPIKFTTADTSGLYNDELVRWKGINFTNVADTSKTSQLKYCILEYNMDNAVRVSRFNNLTVSDCIIRYGLKCGIYLFRSNITVKNCNIYNNLDGIRLSISSGYLINNIISNNSNRGIYLHSFCNPEIINNTVCKNRYGLFIIYGSNPIIKNSIFRGNTSNEILLYNDNNHPEITYCNVQGGKEDIILGYTVEIYKNNIDLEPYFTDIDNMKYSLSDSSNCINTGTPDTTGLKLPAFDIEGNSRIYDGTVDIIDIGAYEFQGEPANRPPKLKRSEDQQAFVNNVYKSEIHYYDPDINDTHTTSITSDTSAIQVFIVAEKQGRVEYEVIPGYNWVGTANIYVTVTDDRGAMDTDTFRLAVNFCGTITENTIWQFDTVKINCDIIIDSAATLTIMPGTVVEFKGEYKLDVKGRLLAVGLPSQPITFTSIDITGNNANSHVNWKGIHFVNVPVNNDTSKLVYCDIKYIKSEKGYGCITVSGSSKVKISGCAIRNNTSTSAGIVVINNALPEITGNLLTNNSNISGPGIFEIINADSKIFNNIICNNYCEYGILYFNECDAKIINNTICNNKVDYAIISGALCNPLLANTIFWDNYSDNILSLCNFYELTGSPIFNSCIIPENLCTEEYTMINITSLDPCFRDEGNMDYSLTDNSLCINRGSPDTTGLNLPAYDIAGNPRIYDGAVDIIDIGAYEFQGEPANKPPVVTRTEDTQNLANTIFKAEVNFSDPDINDEHNVSITSIASETQVFKTGQSPGKVNYEVIPVYNWIGSTYIFVKVTDSQGAEATDTFRLDFTKNICGIITGNTIWELDTVKIDCDILIDSSATLTIMPGTVVEFQGEYMIDVQGAILAEGTQSDYIIFTSSDTAGYHNNSHTGWGGIMFYDTPYENDTSKLTYCIIEYAKNTHSYPDNYGGAVGIKNFSKLVISNCMIRFNYSEYGAGIAVCNARPVIQNNYILLNEGISGAGIYLNCYAKIHNNIICNNNGTGIHISEASPEIVNNTVCHNKEGLGCGFGSNPIIKNSIFSGNTYNQIFLYKDNNHPEIEYCNIEGGLEDIVFNYSIYVYKNNIDLEPYFSNIDNLDYNLTDSSSCINRGTTDTTGLNLPAYDIEGNPRILGDTVDIGAYEFPVNFAPSDILLSNNQVDENVRYGSLVGLLSSVDANAEDMHTYSFDVSDGINDADNSSFVISHDSLKITIYPNHEKKDTFRIFVKTTDNGINNLSCSKAFIINILDINEPPLIHLQSFSVDENSPAGTVVDTLEAMDPDEGQTLFYSIISGNTGDAFAIDPFMGEITVNDSSALDFETTPVFELTMQVEDDGPGNLATEGPITITINDVYEPVGLNKVDAGLFRIYPNPVRKILYIEFPGEDYENVVIEIKSVNGSLVYLKEMNELAGKIKAEIDMSAIPEGLYLLTIKNNRIIITRKIEIIR